MADKIFSFLCVWRLSIDDIIGKYYDRKNRYHHHPFVRHIKRVLESPSISSPCHCRLFKYSHHILIVHLSCFSNDTHNSSLLQSAFYVHLSMAGKRDGGEYYNNSTVALTICYKWLQK